MYQYHHSNISILHKAFCREKDCTKVKVFYDAKLFDTILLEMRAPNILK